MVYCSSTYPYENFPIKRLKSTKYYMVKKIFLFSPNLSKECLRFKKNINAIVICIISLFSVKSSVKMNHKKKIQNESETYAINLCKFVDSKGTCFYVKSNDKKICFCV